MVRVEFGHGLGIDLEALLIFEIHMRPLQRSLQRFTTPQRLQTPLNILTPLPRLQRDPLSRPTNRLLVGAALFPSVLSVLSCINPEGVLSYLIKRGAILSLHGYQTPQLPLSRKPAPCTWIPPSLPLLNLLLPAFWIVMK